MSENSREKQTKQQLQREINRCVISSLCNRLDILICKLMNSSGNETKQKKILFHKTV